MFQVIRISIFCSSLLRIFGWKKDGTNELCNNCRRQLKLNNICRMESLCFILYVLFRCRMKSTFDRGCNSNDGWMKTTETTNGWGNNSNSRGENAKVGMMIKSLRKSTSLQHFIHGRCYLPSWAAYKSSSGQKSNCTNLWKYCRRGWNC